MKPETRIKCVSDLDCAMKNQYNELSLQRLGDYCLLIVIVTEKIAK